MTMRVLTDIEPGASASWFVDELASAAIEAGRDGRKTTLAERSARAGHMAPLHRRDEPETYRVIEGRLTFYVDGDVVVAEGGDVVVAAAHAQRTYRADSDARFLVLTRVRALDRYIDFGRAVAPPLAASASGWPSAEELHTLTSIAAANGIEILGPPGALPDGLG
jgi:quercetin dioxygenase-like cupin family protein